MILRKHSLTMIAATAVVSVLLVGTQVASAASEAQSRSSTLTFVSGPNATITGNENPLTLTSDLASFGVTDWIYEPLIQWDLLKANTTYPWLATSWSWTDNGKQLTLHLRHGVKWSDGQPFTSADVVFTFELIKKYPALNTSNIVFSTITAPNAYSVVIDFPTPQFVNFYDIGSQVIVPKHIWSTVKNPVTYLDKDPIGTGPYLVEQISRDEMTLERNPHYWKKGEPAIDKVVLPVYASNTTGDAALIAGQGQWGNLFLPNFKKDYVDRDPAHRHGWFPGFEDVYLAANLSDYPLNQVVVRKAISDAIDRQTIIKVGEQGELGLNNTPTGLVLPQQAKYLAPEYKNMTFKVDVAAANKMLDKAGYKMGSNGIRTDPRGKPLSFTLESPSPFTDMMSDSAIVASELAKIGIHINVVGTSVSTWTSDEDDGTFQLAFLNAPVGASPYYDFYELDTNDYVPPGRTATNDQERWDNPVTTNLLNEYAATSNPVKQQQVLDQLQSIMVNDIPLIPVQYNAVQQEWSDQDFVGWPTPQDPYSWGAYSPEDEITILHLRPR